MKLPILPARTQLLLAFFLIYFIWGSTYLAIRYAIQTLPPFLMAGTRFLLAGLVLYGLMRLRGEPNPSLNQWRHLAVIGTFLFVGGNGLVVWAEQFIESGLAALLVATLPLWLIAFDWKWAGGPPPAPAAIVGIVCGMAGMFVLVDPASVTGSGVNTGGALVCILASALWAFGSIYSKKVKLPGSIFMSAACQMIGGGLVLLAIGTGFREWQGFELAEVSQASFLAFAYLVGFGSMVAISSYVWLLQNASASSVSTYAFVNPVVALFLGWLIADEQLNWQTVAGAAIILSGVALVLLSRWHSKSRQNSVAGDS